MSQCRYSKLDNPGKIECGMMANGSGYCPRHEMLVPALEAEAAKKEKAKREKKAAELRRNARR